MDRKFHIATFGCRTNQADSAALRQDFLDRGYRETDDRSQADVVVVNSCTVTHRSDQQVRQLTRRLRRDNPTARLLVTGCYAQRQPRALARIKGVDAVVGNTRKSELVQLAEGLPGRSSATDHQATTVNEEATAKEGRVAIPGHQTGRSPQRQGVSRREVAAIYTDDFSKVRAIDLTPATQVGGRTRPFVKIQDGCDAKCTYCIIPSVRGPSRSVPPQQVLEQVRGLVEAGFREIVLTGIHIGTYGMHLRPRFPLDRLLGEIAEVPGLGWLRVSSIEPMELSRRIIDLAADSDKIAPHFHICLQSGSDAVLKRMLRPYDTARFASIVEEIREKIPHSAIGTDIIVGFPGEGEEDHRRSLDFVRRMPFTYLHVFPYSDRSGTTASGMEDKVDPQVIKRRSAEFRKLSDRKEAAFRRSFVGRRLKALTLTDTAPDGSRLALTGNYIQARLPASCSGNQLVQGQALREQGNALVLT
ncbi:MAG TPA: tRNA (N(6)-L-threonylcarbamoyladenosine(37)-C(2))-methylthiotransferase MtaB [Acidobacteriota bacterium]|nr:tRNA (N(6)-L-threonylcarbamoyladenosine(37)-C(2))-methylthiotransferase MtaB [Acidobacteriota bacterium]